MRHYLPGLGRFISRVHLHEAVAMGRTTYQELREVWGINIGPPGTPEAFARNGVPEHPYTYARANPATLADASGLQVDVGSGCRIGAEVYVRNVPRLTHGTRIGACCKGKAEGQVGSFTVSFKWQDKKCREHCETVRCHQFPSGDDPRRGRFWQHSRFRGVMAVYDEEKKKWWCATCHQPNAGKWCEDWK